MERKGYFVSDLHLFARRSSAAQYLRAIHASARQAHTFVLGGDIFDFKWTTLPSVGETVEAGIEWLGALVRPHADCEFHFILGNHDATPLFVERLDTFAIRTPNFSWHRYFLRLEDCLFLHGDIADGKADHEKLEDRRTRWDTETVQSPTSHLLYDLAVRAQLHRLASSLAHRERTVLRHVRTYARRIGHGPEAGTRHIYFGHTHRILNGVHYRGLTFHNGGAAIKGTKFRIVETCLNMKG
jgi:UDP-2,3-diacylglucosamine hydrolase